VADLKLEEFENAPVPRVAPTRALKVGAVGLFGVLFMALANAAPITAMTGNVPIAVGYGNGVYAPAGFVVATIVLTLFTIGYVAMAKHITTAGAFYGFISQGLGQIWGMASGLLATMAYIVFEGSLIGIFAYFANDALNTWFSWNVNWLILGIIGIAIIAFFGYYDINIAAIILGVFLVCEVVLLTALAFSVLFKGGGPNGLMLSSINPFNAFKNLSAGGGVSPAIKDSTGAAIPAGAAAIGVFFAFWSWIGYETTAVYGEESRNPRRIVPRATLFAVVALGVFYSFVSWMVIAGNGKTVSIDKAYNNSIPMFTDLAAKNLGGHWIVNVYLFLIMSGSFACALAFHNAASRYIYAFGRELPGLQKSLGATHSKHHSPYIASAVQSVITLVLTVGFYLLTPGGHDAYKGGYIFLYGLLALLGTMAILIVMAICSIAVIFYFHVRKAHEGDIWTTLIIPIIGFFGMVYVLYLLLSNLSFAGGGAAGSIFYKAIPYIVGVTFIVGLGGALWLRSSRPETYQAVGRTVLEETHERAEV
jgi:amino acid transporter